MGSTGITDYDEQEAAMSKLAETVRELLEEFEHVVLAIETMVGGNPTVLIMYMYPDMKPDVPLRGRNEWRSRYPENLPRKG